MSRENLHLLHKHHAFTSIKDVNTITKVLQEHLNIDYFMYRRETIDFNHNNKRTVAVLANDALALEHIATYNDTVSSLYTINPKDYYFVDAHYPRQVSAMANDLGLYNPFTRQMRISANEWEWVSFATRSPDQKFLNFFLHNRDLLDKFIDYFIEKAEDIIEASVENKFLASGDIGYFDGKKMFGSEKSRELFLSAIKTKHRFLADKFGNRIKIPTAEFENLELLSKGRSIKEIAKCLDLSPRTVETNLIRSKNRLSCHTKKELLDLLEENEV